MVDSRLLGEIEELAGGEDSGAGRDFFVRAASLDQRQLEPTCEAVTPRRADEQGVPSSYCQCCETRVCRYRPPQRSRGEVRRHSDNALKTGW